MSVLNSETTGDPAATAKPAKQTGTPSSATASVISPDQGEARLLRPTLTDPLPAIGATRGLGLLRSAVARTLATSLKADELLDALEAARQVRASLQPATVAEVAEAYEGLALHFPQRKRRPVEDDLVIANWLQDLADMPGDLLMEACRLWRTGDHERFPTCGQLRGLVGPILKHRQALAKRGDDLLTLTS